MFKKSPLKSAKIIKQKRRLLYFKIAGSVIIIVLFIALISYLSHLSYFTIKTVQVSGNQAINAEDVQEIAGRHIVGKYYLLFPKANRFIYPKKAIVADIHTLSQRIKNVSLEVNKNDLVITLTERDPAYTWCSGIPDKFTKHTCYFIDLEGYIFTEAPTFSGNAFFAFYGEVNNENPIGSTYLNAAEFKEIDTLIEFLDSKQIHPFAFFSHDSGTYDIYLEQGGKIIFKEGQDVSILISNLDLIINNTKLFSKAATSSLEYVDLRFGNKLFYKTVGDNALQIEN